MCCSKIAEVDAGEHNFLCTGSRNDIYILYNILYTVATAFSSRHRDSTKAAIVIAPILYF